MAAPRALTARSTWLLPILLITALAAVLRAIYLAGTVDPQGHLEGMPVALVVEEQSAAAGPSSADAVATAIENGGGEAFAVTRMSRAELAEAMQEDAVAGAVVIPADFDASIRSLLPGAASVTVPTVALLTNAGDGGLSSGLLVGNMTPLLRAVAVELGRQLVAAAPDVSAPTATLLASPFVVESRPYEALPESSGMGLSAFYYSLVLVLCGFIGASLVSPLVDAALGFVPSEVGPRVERRPYTALSRRTTYLAKVAILVAAAPCAALASQLVAALFGVSVGEPVLLWLYGTAVVAAIGTSALAVFAIFGPGIGALVNTLFFVALAMVSSAAPSPWRRRRPSSRPSRRSRPTGTSSTAPARCSTSTRASPPASAPRGSAWSSAGWSASRSGWSSPRPTGACRPSAATHLHEVVGALHEEERLALLGGPTGQGQDLGILERPGADEQHQALGVPLSVGLDEGLGPLERSKRAAAVTGHQADLAQQRVPGREVGAGWVDQGRLDDALHLRGLGGGVATGERVRPVQREARIAGLGMAVGNWVGGRLADTYEYRGLVLGYAAVLAFLVLIAVAGSRLVVLLPALFGVGATMMMAIPTIQVLLTRYAPEAPTLMGALNLASLNLANALGAVGGAIAIASGWGTLSTAWAGVALTSAGLLLFAVTVPKVTPPVVVDPLPAAS